MKKLIKESLITEVRNPEEDQWTGYMTINDFSEVFNEFYDKIGEMLQFMDDDTIKYLQEAKILLNKAWENECDAHGVEFHEITF